MDSRLNRHPPIRFALTTHLMNRAVISSPDIRDIDAQQRINRGPTGQ